MLEQRVASIANAMGNRSEGSAGPAELAIVVPTFNERANIEPLLASLRAVLSGIEYEVIFVDDDSTDDTAGLIRQIARRDPRIRVLQRIGRRGLSSASLEGMLASSAPYLALMDADLQHDEQILPSMLTRLKEEQLDLVVATRNVDGGGMGEFSENRVRLSNMGRLMSEMVTHTPLSDPMSGFFILDRRFLDEVVHAASGIGFKILVDLVASAKRPVRFSEVPYTFRKRLHGSSKLDILVGVEYLELLVHKMMGNLIPPRFVMFSLVGAAGYILFIGVLDLLITFGHLDFVAAQLVTTFIAMTVNFFLNNSLTYRDRRLRGKRLLGGLITFYAACAVGVVINLRVADFAKNANASWYIAAAAGLTVGAVWNYGVTSIITWRSQRRPVVRV